MYRCDGRSKLNYSTNGFKSLSNFRVSFSNAFINSENLDGKGITLRGTISMAILQKPGWIGREGSGFVDDQKKMPTNQENVPEKDSPCVQ